MRDALGALGPVDGTNPELSNLTLSVTKIQKGDIILLASDGLTDNFDPNVCKFTVNSNLPDSLKKREPNNTKAKMSKSITPPKKEDITKKAPVKPPRRNYVKGANRLSVERSSGISTNPTSISEDLRKTSIDSVDNKSTARIDLKKSDDSRFSSTVEIVNNLQFSTNNNIDKNDSEDLANSNSANCSQDGAKSSKVGDDSPLDNPLIAQFLRINSLDEDSSLEKSKQTLPVEAKPIRQITTQLSVPASLTMQKSGNKPADKYNFLRSKTSLDLRVKPIQRNEDGIPYVTPIQRYELTLLLMEDILKNGISGRESECVTAKKLCENLMRFTFSITAAKRRTLEDNDLYYDNQNGLLIEVSGQEKKMRRKKGLERVQNLPGKLDHVTVVAFNIGNYSCHT